MWFNEFLLFSSIASIVINTDVTMQLQLPK